MSEELNILGKKFSSDFDRIDEVKGNDKFLVEDSKDGKVKYAQPSQINKMYDKLVADIDTAVEAAAGATSANANAQAAAASATSSKNAAAESVTQARQLVQEAEVAADDAHSATDIAAEGITDTEARLSSLERDFRRLISGEMVVEKIALRMLELYGEFSMMKKGAGAPPVAPDMVPQIYFDTENKVYYVAKGTSSVSDWSVM